MAKKIARKASARKSSTRKSVSRSGTSKRSTVDTGQNKMFAKRTGRGRFKEMDDVGRSLSTDRRQTAKKKTQSGYGDQGDQKARSKKR